MTRFRDRVAAGRALAADLRALDPADPVVLALPRGGVPVAAEIAHALGCPLDLVMVRKIGVPGQPELAAGAVVNGDQPDLVVNEEIAALAGLDRADLDRLAAVALAEIARRRQAYLQGRPQAGLVGRTAVVVDDGIATGASMQAALNAVRRRGAARVVLAVPVAAPETLARLAAAADDVVCPLRPSDLVAVGLHYDDFAQTPDAEVVRLLADAVGIAR